MRHGGQILIDQLEAHGCERVFLVPGESFLPALDGLHESAGVRTIVCRQEGGAAMMAEATAKLSGRPGVCFVTRGPGAANAMSGVHVAAQDSSPMLLCVGLPPQRFEDREAFQEIDLRALFGSLAKSVEVIRETERIPEHVARAWHTALSGRPGPVVLGLPEDVLSARASVADVRPAPVATPAPDGEVMALVQAALERASRPLALIGGPGWSRKARAAMEAFAARFALPVVSAFRCQDYFDNRHPCYAGHAGIGIDPALARRIETADVLLAIGARLGEMTTSGYRLVTVPEPDQFLIHAHPSPDETGRVHRADIAIAATAERFTGALEALEPPQDPPWRDWTRSARGDYEAFLRPVPTPGAVKLEQVVAALSEVLPEDAIVTNGAGNYTAWVHRYHRYRAWRSQLAPTSGSMGYGLPAAIAAKLAAPERMVVAFAGDGCLMMTVQELATAVLYGLPIIVIVVDNGMFGTIRMHQELSFPGRVIGTSLANPDFVALAESFGALGERVEKTSDFLPAFERAKAAERPALIALAMDPEAITPARTLEALRAGDAQ